MKRYNIYLYEYSNGSKGKNVGFCRMDINNDNVKILLSIKSEELGIVPNEIVNTEADLLMEDGERKRLVCDGWQKNIEKFSWVVKMQDEKRIIGASIIYEKKNDIRIKVQGVKENCKFIEAYENVKVKKKKEDEQIRVQEIENVLETSDNQNTSRILQVELEDTVYNVDMECMKERQSDRYDECEKSKLRISGIDQELIKLRLEDVMNLPRECWRINRNKFVICGCNRYGHLAYMKRGDKYIICVPGNMDSKNAGCAKRYGFKSYFPIDESDEKEKYNGYWMMTMSNNGK